MKICQMTEQPEDDGSQSKGNPCTVILQAPESICPGQRPYPGQYPLRRKTPQSAGTFERLLLPMETAVQETRHLCYGDSQQGHKPQAVCRNHSVAAIRHSKSRENPKQETQDTDHQNKNSVAPAISVFLYLLYPFIPCTPLRTAKNIPQDPFSFHFPSPSV